MKTGQNIEGCYNEAMRDWIANFDTTHYVVGSVGPHLSEIVRVSESYRQRDKKMILAKEEVAELFDCLRGRRK